MSHSVLRIYRAASGRWSGAVFRDGEEIAGVAECDSPGEVEDTAREALPDIEVEPSEEARAFWASFEGQPNTDLATPDADELAFFEKLRQEGGGVGYDEQGRYVRGLPGGGIKVVPDTE